MTNDTVASRESEEKRRALMQRLAAASVAAREATERYVEIRRECELTVEKTREMLAASDELRAHLRTVVSSYVSLLRRDGVPPERMLVLVKNAVESAHADLDARGRRAIMDEMVRWAVDAYFAA